MKHLLLAAGLSVGALVAGPAAATIIMVDASSIQGQNVLFNNGVQTGTLVTGLTQAGTEVDFTGTSNGANVIRANGGQARLEGVLDTSTPNPNDTFTLDSLFFDLANGGFFNNLEFNLFGGTATAANFVLTDNTGGTFTFSNQALGSGSNFFGFQGTGGESIKNISITFNSGGVQDTRQIRLDEVLSAIPEPASWAMMIVGLGGMGALMRARRRPAVA